MSKVKFPRKSIALDMTAMCDMAFLLLTFFILTAQFKSPEVTVVTPSSVSDTKLPDKDLLMITIDKEGKIFVGADNQVVRYTAAKNMAEKYQISLSEQELNEISIQASIGMPMAGMKQWLAIPAAKRKDLPVPGIPADSATNELFDWVAYLRYANQKMRIGIKGDVAAQYEAVDKVITTLQRHNINKFNFVTNMEERPKIASN